MKKKILLTFALLPISIVSGFLAGSLMPWSEGSQIIVRESLRNESYVKPSSDNHQIDEVVIVPAGVLYCSDCWLAPVDKTRFLPAGYTPKVVPTEVSGGGNLTPPTVKALKDMFNVASREGVSLSVISSYRSYSYQASLFERYVQEEIAKGLSRAEAEAEANTYSARAGTSEHQLGTTVDIGCPGCAFEESTANLKVWEWLADNAYKYGFVLSYPKDRTAETGYIYEPWHWRFIGEENTAKYNSQKELTLNHWLAQNWQ